VKRFIAVLVIAAIMAEGIWLIVFPERTLVGLIADALGGGNLTVEVTGMKKGFFYSFTAETLEVKRSGKPGLTAENVYCRPDLSSLLILKPALAVDGNISGGRMRGRIGLMGSNGGMDMEVTGAKIQGLPFLASFGLQGEGNVSGRLVLNNSSGVIRFSLDDAHMKPAAFAGLMVPLDLFSTGRGALTVAGDTIGITSFTLEGKDIYARLRGNVTGKAIRLTMELMPEKSFVDKNPIFTLLAAYKDSPGHYSIPISTTVNF
jgi:type II secretion system protein N